MAQVQNILRVNFCVQNKFCYTSKSIVFIGCFREEEESEEDEEMENQENGDTDAKKTVEGTAQDYPMARCLNMSVMSVSY